MKALQIVRQYFPDVKSVKDAKENILIEVSTKDTKSALVRNHKACALAVACKNKVDVDGVIVSISKAYIIKDRVAYRYTVSQHAQREIVSFDRNARFMPGEYMLNAPAKTHRLGQITGSGTHSKDRNASTIIRRKTEGIRTVLGSGLQ